jgi:hypothetical protein
VALSPEALRAALAEVPDIDGDIFARGTPVAARLCAFLEEHRAESSIVDLGARAFSVEFVVAAGEPRYWEIECLSRSDFRMYPGFQREDHIVWANVWIRGSNLTVDELVDQLNEAAFRKDEFENA